MQLCSLITHQLMIYCIRGGEIKSTRLHECSAFGNAKRTWPKEVPLNDVFLKLHFFRFLYMGYVLRHLNLFTELTVISSLHVGYFIFVTITLWFTKNFLTSSTSKPNINASRVEYEPFPQAVPNKNTILYTHQQINQLDYQLIPDTQKNRSYLILIYCKQ